ncbi:MAG TPA: hypothetical protein VK470_04060 [Bacteroidota bacterium]|nr:hypothetical protein [Bacteroidota bacterium]
MVLDKTGTLTLGIPQVVDVIGVDAVGVTLAFFSLINPMGAALIHVGSEMAFILNSARLFRRG